MRRTPSIDSLAWAIERDGIRCHEANVAAVLDRLDRVGSQLSRTATLRAIVADRTQPAVARERAFGRLLVAAVRPQPAVVTVAAASRAPRPAAA
jgi:hypothetical protein